MININSKKILEELNEYVQARGIKFRWIAEQIGITESSLSHSRSGDRNLGKETLLKIQKLIRSNLN